MEKLNSSSKVLVSGLFLISILVLIFYFFSDIFQPIIFGFLLAYFLDPITDKLENIKIPRFLGSLFLIFISFFILTTFIIFILPVFYRQLNQFIMVLPGLYEWVLNFIEINYEKILGRQLIVDNYFENFQDNIQNNIGFLFENFLSSTLGIINFVLNSLITFFLTFYLLLDWDRIVSFVYNIIPNQQKKITSEIFVDINFVLSKLFRGQLSVCLILSVYYGLSLFFVGLEGGLILGLLAGFISFIPLIGAVLGGGLAVLLGALQFFDTPLSILIILIIFLVGQIIEGNYLTPRFVGRSMGIHPVWLIISLAFFGKIGGITGLILALPITAILGVLAKHILKVYYSSAFFNSKGT